jgi:hypothetical protein
VISMIISSLFFIKATGLHTINPLAAPENLILSTVNKYKKMIDYKLDSSACGVLGETSVALATPILSDP